MKSKTSLKKHDLVVDSPLPPEAPSLTTTDGIPVDQSIVACQVLVLMAWPSITKALIARAMSGDVEAARELRLGILEPMTQRKPDDPKDSESIQKALAWLPSQKPTEMPLG